MIFNQNICKADKPASSLHRSIKAGVIGLVASLYAVSPAFAGTYDDAMAKTKYVVMTGDVNADGQNDILFIAAPRIVMIPLDDDLIIPIPLAPLSPSFSLISTGYGVYTLTINPSAATLASTAWKPATQQIAYSGVNGAYAASVSITATSNNQASFVISMTADGQIQVTSTTPPLVNGTQPNPSAPLNCDD